MTFSKRKKLCLLKMYVSHMEQNLNKNWEPLGGSNFSFYYAHHMSTIEGGMICTNDKKHITIYSC